MGCLALTLGLKTVYCQYVILTRASSPHAISHARCVSFSVLFTTTCAFGLSDGTKQVLSDRQPIWKKQSVDLQSGGVLETHTE